MKNRPEYGPLRAAWNRFGRRDLLAEEWGKFEPFFDAMLEAGWAAGDAILRADRKGPLGPNNFTLQKCNQEKLAVRKAVLNRELAATKGGSKNSPCIGCSGEVAGTCECYKTCKAYKLWISACWRDFKIAAEGLPNEEV